MRRLRLRSWLVAGLLAPGLVRAGPVEPMVPVRSGPSGPEPRILARIHTVALGGGTVQETRWYRLIQADARGRFGPVLAIEVADPGADLRIPLARILEPTGAVDLTGVPGAVEVSAPTPGARVVRVVAPEASPGSMLEVAVVSRRGLDPEALDFAPAHWFGSDQPIGSDVFEIRVPAARALDLRWIARGLGAASTPGESWEEGDRVLRWQARDLPPSRHASSRRPYVRTTLLPGWGPVSDWYRERYRSRQRADPGIEALAGRLAPPGTGPDEAIARLSAWVSRNIRYRQVETGDVSDLCGRPASVVVADGRGNCADQVNLLVVLLRLAGLEAEAVLVARPGFRPLDPELPTFVPADHVVVRVRDRGSDRFVDPTARHFRYPALPRELHGALGFEPAGSRFLTLAPGVPDRLDRRLDLRLGPAGGLVGTLGIRAQGEPAALLRAQLEGRGEGERTLLELLPAGFTPAPGEVEEQEAAGGFSLRLPVVRSVLRSPEGRPLFRIPLPESLLPRCLSSRSWPDLLVTDRARMVLPPGSRVEEFPVLEVEAGSTRVRLAGQSAGSLWETVASLEVRQGTPHPGPQAALRQRAAGLLGLVGEVLVRGLPGSRVP